MRVPIWNLPYKRDVAVHIPNVARWQLIGHDLFGGAHHLPVWGGEGTRLV